MSLRKILAPEGVLTYHPLFDMPGLEICFWHGSAGGPALAPHFHREAQLTIIQNGFRLFSIGPDMLKLGPGQFILIPSGVPHRAIGHSAVATRSHDVFFDVFDRMPDDPCQIIIGEAPIKSIMQLETVINIVLDCIEKERTEYLETCFGKSNTSHLLRLVQKETPRISEVATQAGLSREGFIRVFRKHIGMTPHAYRLAAKVCRARELLRQGESPAGVAYEAGFSDQSHLGRVFQRLYGTTPGAFRRAWHK